MKLELSMAKKDYVAFVIGFSGLFCINIMRHYGNLNKSTFCDDKVIGLIKDELGGKIMTGFVALRAKMYAYRNIDKEVEEKCCKGTKKCVVSEALTFDDCKTCLFDGKTICREQMLFENKKNEVHMVNNHKIAQNRDNDKRIVQANGE